MGTSALIGASLGLVLAAASGAVAAIATPHDHDAFSRLVTRAQALDETVDFHALRFAWLDSAARRRATDIQPLTADMDAAFAAHDAARTRADAERILSIDYTDMWAHSRLRLTCRAQHDSPCGVREHFVEFGLLGSIIYRSDGRSEATAWDVAETAEEQFVFVMYDVRVVHRSRINDHGRTFDQVDTLDEHNAPVTYYFDVTTLLAKQQ